MMKPAPATSANAHESHVSSPIDELLDIMRRLRAEGGCPWDREQTLATLKPYLVEECYEVLEAVDADNPELHREELGDVLLQIVFHAQIRHEAGQFDFHDVARAINEKMIRRHPHVFGDESVADSAEVLRNWEELKAAEKKDALDASAVAGVPPHLPALHRAQKTQAKAARVGFDWDSPRDVLAKIKEEVAEVEAAMAGDDEEATAEEIGDLLFAVVNLSRALGGHAEDLLRSATDKFSERFRAMESRLTAEGRSMEECSLAELDGHWDAVKEGERGPRQA